MTTKSMIKTNDDGKPWTAIRTVNGKATIVTKILSGDKYIEVPAATALAIINGPAKKPAAKATTNRQAATSEYLRELSMRYAAGGVR
jgi:hypothetical protein